MSLVQYNNFNQPNLNGLVDINADTIITDTISTTEIIINGENIVDDVLDNKRKLTKIDYDDITDTTEIDSNLSLTGSLRVDDITISQDELKYLDGVTSNIQNQLNIESADISVLQQKTTKISYNSGTNTTTADSNFTVNNELNVTSELTLKNDPGASGFTFLLNNNNKYLYFRVKDNSGNLRSFQIHHSQIFTNLPVFYDSNVTLPQSRILFLGENSNAIRFLANADVNAGMKYENRINNFYTNFSQRNTTGTDITTFRLHHTKLDSLIRHDFFGETNFNEITSLYKNLVFNHSNVKLVVNGSIEITQQELAYLTGLTSNIQTQINSLNDKTTKITYNSGTDTSSINSKLIVSGETTFNGIVNLNDDLYQYQNTFLYKNLVFTASGVKLLVLGGTVEITQQELSYLSGLTDDIQFQIDTVNNKTNKISYDSVNDITTINSKVNINGNLTLQNVIHKPGANYEIENTTNAGSIIFKVRDSGGTVRSITINQFTNISGINDVGCNKVVMGGTTLRENGSVVSGGITFNGSIVSNNSATFNNGISTVTGSLTQSLASGVVQMSFLSTGTNTFKGSDYFGRINMTSTDPAQNRIVQTIISGDLTTGNANLFKNTQIRQTTGGVNTNMPILDCFETSTNKKFHILMNSFSGSYNAINEPGSISNVCIGPTQNNAILTYTCWASQRVGFKFKTSSSTNYTSEFWAGNATNMIMDSNNGTSMTNVSSIALSGAGNRTIDSNFGSIYTATLLTAVSMSSSTETNLSNGLVLPAGTYNISWNINFIIQTSGTNVDGYYGCYSTSTTAFTNNTILTSNFNGSTISVNNVFSLTGQDYVHFNSSTTIYLRALVGHNKGANHVVFHDPFSHLKAIKIC
jgi:hypothetical protein